MQFKFTIEWILLLPMLVVCNSQQNDAMNWAQILTMQSNLSRNVSRCVSYRYVPCQLEDTNEFVSNEEGQGIFLKLEKQCIFYRYIPCQEGWSTFTIVYENEADFLQRENIRMIGKSWRCQMEQIREKNESVVLLNRVDEEKQYLHSNLTECLRERRDQSSLFESQIGSCQTLNQSLQENLLILETNQNTLKSDLDWCLSDGKDKISPIQAELQKCQQISSLLNEVNLICKSKKMETEANYSMCLVEEKQESMRFHIDLKNCLDLRDSIRLSTSNCKSENKVKEVNLIDCQNKVKNKTLILEAELEKCQSLNNSSNVKLLSCDRKQTKLQSSLTACLNEGKKNTLRFNDEIEIHQTLNNSLYEKIIGCESEKNHVLSALAKCSNEVLNSTLILESKVNQLKEETIVLNDKVLSCDAELTREKSNYSECINEEKIKTLWFQTEMKNCQDAQYSVKENTATCETEKKQVEVNLTKCLMENENMTVEWFNVEGKKFELLTNTFNETAFACNIEKKKQESNLTECFISFRNKISSLEEDITNYQALNNSLSEKIVACNIEKADLAPRVNGCLLETSNVTKLLEAVINKYQNMSSVLNENVTSCNREKTRIMSKLISCLGDQQKDTTLSPAERWNREKNLLIDYMASWWNGTTFPIVNNPPSYDSINVYIRYNVVRLGLFPLTWEEELKPEYGAVINDVLSFEYYLDIPSCSVPPSIRSIFIAVMTRAQNFERRNRIRYNYVSHIKAAAQRNPPIIIHFGFFIGLPDDSLLQTAVEEESDTFGDIVQIEMNDTYRNSPLKMAAVLYWVMKNCGTVDLMIKMEDATEITILSMANFVKTWYTATNSMFGKPANTIPSRDGQKNITIQEYPWNNYPDYFDGSTYYILHGTTVRPLLAAMQTTPFFPLEDVYVTGICRVKAGISRINCDQNDRPEICFA